MTDITVPTLGESVSEATVGAWQVSEGDAVKKDDVLVELETDKVSVEVRAEEDGVLSAITAKEGDTVEIGAKLAELESGGAASKKADTPAPEKDAKAAKSGDATASDTPSGSGAQAKEQSGGDLIEVKVPVMGESVSEGTVGAWLVKVGERVEQDQALMEIETDKVAVEVPAAAAGVLEEQLVSEGDSVEPDQVVAKIRAGASAGAASGAASKDEAASSSAQDAPTPSGGDKKPMPSARRVAEENDLDLAKIEGSGKDGRVTKGDALKAIESGAAAPAAKPAPSGPARDTGPREERVKMTRMRQTIARRLKEAQSAAAMLTTYNEADMGAIMALRKDIQDDFVAKHGVKLGFMSFFVKACVTALKELPAVNAEIDGTDIIYKNYYDMGVAVGTDRGLVVPVVRDADAKSLAEIEKSIMDLGRRARDGKLGIEDMQGASFTLSNGGVYGSLLSSPILNAPQSGILGMHKIQERPVAINGEVKIRPMMYLALSYDHRIVDGKEAVTFLVRVKESLENPQRMLLDI
jgi:2-oxoglutarate dehydrogenase E2 component (dihydrolipoamide succinyltransferase)